MKNSLSVQEKLGYSHYCPYCGTYIATEKLLGYQTEVNYGPCRTCKNKLFREPPEQKDSIKIDLSKISILGEE